MYTLYRTYSNIPSYHFIRGPYESLEVAKGFLPLYEDQGFAIAISDADHNIVYLSPGIQ